MSQNERNQFLELIRSKQEELAGNKKASRSFLEEAGIVNRRGKLKKEYKDLCIPRDQA